MGLRMPEIVGKLNFPITTCTPGEFEYIKKTHSMLIEKLGSDHLVVIDDHHRDALPLIFVFYGTERQRDFWMRDKDINPKHVRMLTDPGRLQGIRARVMPVRLDHYWTPFGIDERNAAATSEWYISDLRSRFGDLWDVCRYLHPEDQKRWVRLA